MPVGVFLRLFQLFWEFVVFSLKHKDFKALLEIMNDFWPWDKFGPVLESRVQKFSNKGYFLIKCFVVMIFLNCTNIVLTPLLTPGRNLPYVQYDFCNMQTDVCYIGNLTFQLLNLIFTQLPVLMGFDLLFLSFVTQLYIAFELLNAALDQSSLSAENHYLLKEIVDQHNTIIRYQ